MGSKEPLEYPDGINPYKTKLEGACVVCVFWTFGYPVRLWLCARKTSVSAAATAYV